MGLELSDSVTAAPKVSRARTVVVAAGCLLVAALCIYRIGALVPQPLDAPGTFRPILNQWLVSYIRLFPTPGAAYTCWRVLCLVSMFVPAALAFWNYKRPGRSRWLFLLSIGVCLLVCRFPSLVAFQLNPDEAEFLSAAQKLFYDSNFFRSVDCGTSGPLNIYPLMLPAIFGITPDFASSRLLMVLIAFAVCFLLYRTVALIGAESLARVAILPLVAAFASFRQANLLHYSSEQIPMLLVAVTLYLTVRVLRNPAAYRLPLVLLGLLISVGFFSKMQSVPVIGSMAAVAVLYVHYQGKARRIWEPALLTAAGTLSLLIANAVFCYATGVLNSFWISYIVSNQRYTQLDSRFIRDFPGFIQYLFGTEEIRFLLFLLLALAVAVYTMSRSSDSRVLRVTDAGALVIVTAIVTRYSNSGAAWLYLALIALLLARLCTLAFHRSGHFGSDLVRWFGLLCAVCAAAAVFSVYKPHRYFPHYLLFLLTPVSVTLAWMLVRQESRRRLFPLLFLTLTMSQETYLWAFQDDHNFQNIVPLIRSADGDFIRSLVTPRGKIFVWGWTADPYLGSGHVVATRDLNLFYFFLAPREITSYYRDRFMTEMRAAPPELFIDAVSPVSWSMWDPGLYRFDQFTDVAFFVRENYIHVADGYGCHYFLRRDLAARRKAVPQPPGCLPQALRCSDAQAHYYAGDGSVLTEFRQLPPLEMPEHALIEAKFTPMARQTADATVFQNESAPRSYRGYRFLSIGGDRYRLLLGLGTRWAFSKSIYLPPGQPVDLSVEINHQDVFLRANGLGVDDMHLPTPPAASRGVITTGTWIDGACRFTGSIPLFQILDLEARR